MQCNHMIIKVSHEKIVIFWVSYTIYSGTLNNVAWKNVLKQTLVVLHDGKCTIHKGFHF